MKNIHILPTDKPSEFYSIDGKHKLANSTMAMDWYISSVGYKPHNICITSDEKIKKLDWYIADNKLYRASVDHMPELYTYPCKKIILTTDQDLIKDGVQAIDDEFLEWFVKNPSCEEVEVIYELNINGKNGLDRARFVYKIIIPKEEQDKKLYSDEKEFYKYMAKQDSWKSVGLIIQEFIQLKLKEQDKKLYSEEEVLKYVDYYEECYAERPTKKPLKPNEWFEQFKNK